MKEGCNPEIEKTTERGHDRGVEWALHREHVRAEIFITSRGEAKVK